MIGAMVRLEPTAWGDALERLEAADLGKIRQDFPDYPYPDLLRALAVGVEALEPADRERYVELAVFPEDLAVPAAAVEVLWSASGASALDGRDRIRRLVARSLARRDEAGRLLLHDLQADYIRCRAGDLAGLHGRLVDGYRERCPEGFHQGPTDGYFYERLAYHLKRAELRQILGDDRWLEAKLRHTGVQALIADFDELSPGDPLTGIQESLRLAAHVLARYPEQLRSQL